MVLTDIYSWYESAECQIYALDGLAGIGKSMVVRTVAQEAHRCGWLSTSFLFSRSKNDHRSAKLFFSTITFQLSKCSKEVTLHIGEALDLDPNASGKQL